MRTIDIVFTRPVEPKPGSYLIRKATNRDYSHCAMVWEVPELRISLAYQATLGGVQFWSKKRFMDHNLVVKSYKLVVSEDQHFEIIRKAVELSGDRYGYLSVLGQGIVLWVESIWKTLTGKRVKLTAPWGDGRRTSFCSELLGYVVLQLVFKDHIPAGDLDDLKTDDLDELLEKLTLIYPEQIKLLKI